MPRKTKAQIEAELFAQQEEATIQAMTEEVSLPRADCYTAGNSPGKPGDFVPQWTALGGGKHAPLFSSYGGGDLFGKRTAPGRDGG